MQPSSKDSVSPPKGMVYLGFAFGCVAILVVIASIFLVGFVGQKFDRQIVYTLLDFLQLILAMALAGVASSIPGFLEVFTKYTVPKRWLLRVRAGGALAVFVLILVLKPADGLKKMVDYNQTLSDAKLAISWSRNTSGNVPGPNAYELCQELVRLDPSRWEGYYCLGRYYFFRRNYQDMAKLMEDSLALYLGEDKNINVDALFIKTAKLRDLNGVEIVRNVAIARLGLVRFDASDPGIAQAAFDKSLDSIGELGIETQELQVGIKYDRVLLDFIVWLSLTPEHMVLDYDARRSQWTNFIDKGLEPFPVAWAYYHRAAIDARMANLLEAGKYERTLKVARLPSPSFLRKRASEDIILSLEDILKATDYLATQKEWFKFYLLGEGNPKSPRSIDPYLSSDVQSMVQANNTLRAKVSSLLL